MTGVYFHETEELLEIWIYYSPISPEQERRLLENSTPESGTGEEASNLLNSLTLKKRRMAGAAKNQLHRLFKSEVLHEIIESVVTKGQIAGPQQERGSQITSSEPEGTSYGQMVAGLEGTKLFFRIVMEEVKLGIIHSEHPEVSLSDGQFCFLHGLIMAVVEDIPTIPGLYLSARVASHYLHRRSRGTRLV